MKIMVELEAVPEQFVFDLEKFFLYAKAKHGHRGWVAPYQAEEWIHKASEHLKRASEIDPDTKLPHLMNAIARLIQIYHMEFLDGE